MTAGALTSAPPPAEASAHPRGTWFDPAARRLVEAGELLDRLAGKRAVLLGETHDVAEIHRWQLAAAAALHARQPNLAVGFEMFPRSTQPVLDRWVVGALGTEAFLAEAGWYEVWGFDPELYLPLFHWCRQARVPMLALNCYRALVSRVRQVGWDAIPEAERDGLTPSAPALAAHKAWLAELMGGLRGQPVAVDARFEGFVAAHQTRDRAFACNIARALQGPAAPALVVGIIGRGHLEFGYGTPYQLQDLGIAESAVLLTTTEADDPVKALQPGIADAVFKLDRPEEPAGRPARLGLKLDAALRIVELTEEGAAARGGLQVGDRLQALAGRPLSTPADYWTVARRLVAGVTLPALVRRGEAELAFAIEVLPPAPLGRPPA